MRASYWQKNFLSVLDSSNGLINETYSDVTTPSVNPIRFSPYFDRVTIRLTIGCDITLTFFDWISKSSDLNPIQDPKKETSKLHPQSPSTKTPPLPILDSVHPQSVVAGEEEEGEVISRGEGRVEGAARAVLLKECESASEPRV